jgi:hypothetical protein
MTRAPEGGGKGLVVLVPTLDGKIEGACDEGLRALEKRGVEVRRTAGCSAIDFARSSMATRALADGFDELLWIDDDIVFDPDDVERIRASAHPFVAGPCAKRGVPSFAFDVLPGTESLKFGQGGGIVDVLFVGMGFVYTRREIYEAIAAELPVCSAGATSIIPYFIPFVLATDAGHKYLSEDFAFCERTRRAGYRILLDTRIRLYHLGSHRYGWEDAGGHAVPRAPTFMCKFE